MKKSAYMLLTIVAALAALFFLGYWMGYGIPLAAQATIFDKFERVLPADDGKGKKIAGFGLGLSYVMNVVREHGGYVTVESVEGKFSEFTLSLPLPDESPEADAREG